MRSRTTIALALLVGSVACDKAAPPPTPATPATNAAPEAPAQTAAQPQTPPATPSAAGTWESVSADALTDAEKALVERGKAAQQSLGGQLVGALTQSVQRDGFAASIEFCRGEAPNVTAKIAAEQGVRLGRTSHKLRNPTNAAPAWAAETVMAAAPGGPHLFRSSTGAIGVLSPIMTAELCVNCHGPAEKLAEGVGDAVAKAYPDDQATGFAPGDLRGWIWAEVQ